MQEIGLFEQFDPGPRKRLPAYAHPLTGEWPGRNHSGIGHWLVSRYCDGSGHVVDPMMGAGQLWLTVPSRLVLGCEASAEGAFIASYNLNRPVACAKAEWWAPHRSQAVELVAFSEPYPGSHSSGGGAHQQEIVKRKGAHANQAFQYWPDMEKVLRMVRFYHPNGPTALIVRNQIAEGVETTFVESRAQLLLDAGYDRVDWFWYYLTPGMHTQWKLKADPSTPWVNREFVLVGSKW